MAKNKSKITVFPKSTFFAHAFIGWRQDDSQTLSLGRMTPGWCRVQEGRPVGHQDDSRMMEHVIQLISGGFRKRLLMIICWEALQTTCLILLQAEIQRIGSLWVLNAKTWKCDPYISNGLLYILIHCASLRKSACGCKKSAKKASLRKYCLPSR